MQVDWNEHGPESFEVSVLLATSWRAELMYGRRQTNTPRYIAEAECIKQRKPAYNAGAEIE